MVTLTAFVWITHSSTLKQTNLFPSSLASKSLALRTSRASWSPWIPVIQKSFRVSPFSHNRTIHSTKLPLYNPRSLTTFVSVAFLCASCVAQEQKKLSYADLVGHLTDLEALAVLPAPGEKCAQESSTDRNARYDEASDTYVDWEANIDSGITIEKKEGEKIVLAEMKGPGCIWRIWSGEPAKKNIQVILDGAKEATLDMPFEEYFKGRAGEWPPFDNKQTPAPPSGDPSYIINPVQGSALLHNAAAGWNCYIPIPFQKSCKVLADPWIPPYNRKGWGMFFEFTYSTFPKDTVVPTFDPDLPAADRQALVEANTALAQCGADPAGERPGQKAITRSVSVEAGTTATILDLEGPRAITALRVKLPLPTIPGDREILRKLVLRITWDNDKRPGVWSPLGDFFGTAPGVNEYRSLPLGMTSEGFYSYWYMPFASRAHVELVNDDAKDHDVTFSITHAPLTRPIEELGRFHAKWHRDTGMDPKRPVDWPMLKTQGRGRFCGVMLNVWNPARGWWGEGDEKFFVDGEKYPSTLGTGSEDYFGYAWANGTPFQHAFHNQTISRDRSLKYNGTHELQSLNRWHIADNVPFQKSFEAYIEKYSSNFHPTRYDCMAYWYLAPGGEDPYNPLPAENRVQYLFQHDIDPGIRFGYYAKEAFDREVTPGSKNFVPFGSAEEWSQGLPLGWGMYTGGGTPTIGQETSRDFVTDGKSSIKVEAVPAVCGIWIVFDIDPSSVYKVMIDSILEEGEGKFQFNRNDVGVLCGVPMPKGRESSEFVIPSGANATKLELYCLGTVANTRFYIDNMRVYKIADLPAE